MFLSVFFYSSNLVSAALYTTTKQSLREPHMASTYMEWCCTEQMAATAYNCTLASVGVTFLQPLQMPELADNVIRHPDSLCSGCVQRVFQRLERL